MSTRVKIEVSLFGQIFLIGRDHQPGNYPLSLEYHCVLHEYPLCTQAMGLLFGLHFCLRKKQLTPAIAFVVRLGGLTGKGVSLMATPNSAVCQLRACAPGIGHCFSCSQILL